MTHIEQAIRDAVKAGWRKENIESGIDLPSGFNFNYDCALDPSFWQALAKARGWERTTIQNPMWPVSTAWELMWHLLIHHLADGKDAESFFASL